LLAIDLRRRFYLLRYRNYVIGTALLRARYASGIRNAPSEAGGKDNEKNMLQLFKGINLVRLVKGR
jgi:hypothetical protein